LVVFSFPPRKGFPERPHGRRSKGGEGYLMGLVARKVPSLRYGYKKRGILKISLEDPPKRKRKVGERSPFYLLGDPSRLRKKIEQLLSFS